MMAETNEGIENSVVPTVLTMIIGDRKFVPATELEAMAVELAETEAARVAVVERERKVAAMLEAATAMLEASRDILPDPEHTSPAHLRFAAEVIADDWDSNRDRYPDLSIALRHKADRLEREQAEVAKRDALIEKAVQTMSDRRDREVAKRDALIEKAAQTMSDRCDRGSVSLPWDRLPEGAKESWRENARALSGAGLLRDAEAGQ